jgi:hypothetical protein
MKLVLVGILAAGLITSAYFGLRPDYEIVNTREQLFRFNKRTGELWLRVVDSSRSEAGYWVKTENNRNGGVGVTAEDFREAPKKQ